MIIKLCNHAADRIEGNIRVICTSYEDNNIDVWADAEALFDWLNTSDPDAFVLVQTGDYIVPPCAIEQNHVQCETYDNYNNRLILMARVTWDANKDRVEQIDAMWRKERMLCLSIRNEVAA
jgi:hypothetical protein